MKSLHQLPSLAALVAGSSIALLTGAQAATLDFGPGLTPPPPPGVSQVVFVNTGGSAPPGQLTVGTDFDITGNASFDSVSGTFTYSPTNAGDRIAINGYDPNLLVFNIVSANSEMFTFTGGADSLTATLNITKIMDTSPVLVGGYRIDSISGSPAFTDNFGAPGSTGNFSWTLNGGGPGSLGRLLATPPVSSVAASTSTGTLTPVSPPSEVPLPPAIYLFGSVLGSAFWLGRKKRNSVSGLSSA